LLEVFQNIEVRFRKWRNHSAARIFSSRFGRKFAWQILPKNVEAITSRFHDHRFTYNPHELVGRRLMIKGQFDREETVSVLNRAQDLGILSGSKRVILEIGANIGTQSVYFALDPRVEKVIAIEPEPGNLKFLLKNVSDNDLSSKIDIAPYGASIADGEMELYLASSNSGAASFHKVNDAIDIVRVKTKPVSMILSEKNIAPKDIALIWMDIEGYEIDIFKSILPILADGMLLYMEFSPGFYGPVRTKSFIEQLATAFKTAQIFSGNTWTCINIIELAHTKKQINIMLRYGQ
jgi:FkbM family methyltransferase